MRSVTQPVHFLPVFLFTHSVDRPASKPMLSNAVQSEKSIQLAFLFFFGSTLTKVVNGTMATRMSSFFFEAFFSVSIRLCAADCSAASLPLWSIEPVLSSASASSSRRIPHTTSVSVRRSIWVTPNKRKIVVSSEPLATSLILLVPPSLRERRDGDHLLALRVLEVGLEVYLRFLVELRRGETGGFLRQHDRRGIDRGLHLRAHRSGARVIDGRADGGEDRADAEREHGNDAAALVL